MTSPKPAFRASSSISDGVKKLMNGVPLVRAPCSASRSPGRIAGSDSSIGSTKVIASMNPAARHATCRKAEAFASLLRYRLTPAEATTDTFRTLVALVCAGLLDLGKIEVCSFAMEELPQATDQAGRMRGLDCTVVRLASG